MKYEFKHQNEISVKDDTGLMIAIVEAREWDYAMLGCPCVDFDGNMGVATFAMPSPVWACNLRGRFFIAHNLAHAMDHIERNK